MAAVRDLIVRMVFEPGALGRPERVLGFIVLGALALGAWLIFWPFVPPLIARLAIALLDLLVAVWNAIPPLTWPEWLRWPWR